MDWDEVGWNGTESAKVGCSWIGWEGVGRSLKEKVAGEGAG